MNSIISLASLSVLIHIYQSTVFCCQHYKNPCGYGQCCEGFVCDAGVCQTCIHVPHNDYCYADSQCCSWHCLAHKCVSCLPLNVECKINGDCCSKNCHGKCIRCVPLNQRCTKGACCAPNVCNNGVCAKCIQSGSYGCNFNKDCCSNMCKEGRCCNNAGGACPITSTCCSGRCTFNGETPDSRVCL